MKGDKEFKKVEKLLKEMEEVIGRQLTRSQKALAEKLTDAISGASSKGKISNGAGLSRVIEKGYYQFENDELPKVIKVIVKHLVDVMDANKAYFTAVSGQTIGDEKKFDILKRLGVDASNRTYRLVAGGYLESLVYNKETLNAVKRVILNSVFGDVELTTALRQTRQIVEGVGGSEGRLVKYYKTFVYDVLQRASRFQADSIAKSVNLHAFIYGGTVIEKTRSFCAERAGEVFTREEAEKWKELDWSGKNEDYVPLRDLGGYNCRHNVRWITAAEAIRRRPELANYFKNK